MTIRKIPGLNYNTPNTLNDLEHYEDTLTNELTQRTQDITGRVLDKPEWGIVDVDDPSMVINNTTPARPLQVDINGTNPNNIDVNPGTGYCSSGHFVTLATKQENIPLTSGSPSSPSSYVVYLEYKTIPDLDTKALTRYDSTESRLIIREADSALIKVVGKTDFDNPSIYTPKLLTYIVVLCIANYVSNGTPSPELQIDQTNNNADYVRHWFSAVDIRHRAQVGTGSPLTPHSLGLSDISQGDLTLYQQLLPHGMALSRPSAVPNTPGYVCIETITGSNVTLDANGVVTGTAGLLYAYLSRFPVKIIGATTNLVPPTDVACDFIPHTNILIFPNSEIIGQEVYIAYTAVDAGEPCNKDQILVRDELTIRGPRAGMDLAIAGGKGLTAFGTDRISLGTAGPIPKRFVVYATGSGDFVLCPQILECPVILDEIGTGIQTITVTQIAASRIRIGLTIPTMVGPVPTNLEVKIQINGKDIEGVPITEYITFNQGNWSKPAPGVDCVETSTNFQLSTQIFSQVDSYQVINRMLDGPSSIIIIYAEADPMVLTGFTDLPSYAPLDQHLRTPVADYLPIAEVMWDGYSICNVKDMRPINYTLTRPEKSTKTDAAAYALLNPTYFYLAGQAAWPVLVATDDFMAPQYYNIFSSTLYPSADDGLFTTFVPGDPAGITNLPYGVRTRAITCDWTTGKPFFRMLLCLFGHDCAHFNGTGVLYRFARHSLPTTWSAWAPLTAVTPNTIGQWLFPIIYPIPDNDLADLLKIEFAIAGPVRGWSLLGIFFNLT